MEVTSRENCYPSFPTQPWLIYSLYLLTITEITELDACVKLQAGTAAILAVSSFSQQQ